MDWFKYLKRSGKANKWDDFIVWRYKFNFPFYKYYTDIQFQVFPKGFEHTIKGLNVKPFEFRCSILAAYQIGNNIATGIYLDKEVYEFYKDDKNFNWWKVFPKEQINEILNKHHTEICSNFIKVIFEKSSDPA